MRLTPNGNCGAGRWSGPSVSSAAPTRASHGPTWDGTSPWVSARSSRIFSFEWGRPSISADAAGEGCGFGQAGANRPSPQPTAVAGASTWVVDFGRGRAVVGEVGMAVCAYNFMSY